MKRAALQKLARIDRELAQTAAHQAQLYAERAALLDGQSAEAPVKFPRPPEPEIAPVSDLASQRAKTALREIRTGRRVRA